ncbi:hypothetical protein FIM12_05460 [SAR202 cluster bacterium AD-804-J14_MRT_500m]|nr:hypothetical protein [SAR202 cluster bacterium AD-804-J14_MRT_500m]
MPPSNWRKLFHVLAGSIIPVMGIFVSSQIMVNVLLVISGLAILSETARFTSPSINKGLVRLFKPLLKPADVYQVTSATYMVIAALGCFLLFDKSIAVAALLFLSVGDPVASLTGIRMSGFRIGKKSPRGSIAFFIVTICLSLVLWGMGIAHPLWALIIGGAVATSVELAPVPLDDNATIPLVSGAAISILPI